MRKYIDWFKRRLWYYLCLIDESGWYKMGRELRRYYRLESIRKTRAVFDLSEMD